MLQPMTLGELIATLQQLPEAIPVKMGTSQQDTSNFGEPRGWRNAPHKFNLPPGDTHHTARSLHHLLANQVLSKPILSRDGEYEMLMDSRVHADDIIRLEDTGLIGVKITFGIALLLRYPCSD